MKLDQGMYVNFIGDKCYIFFLKKIEKFIRDCYKDKKQPTKWVWANKTTAVDSVEIWHDGKIVAGEIGFRTGTAYASLSGFHTEDNIGHVQMAVLGLWLRENGFAFWDLGMSLPYKYRYGAADYDRDEQEKMMDKINGTKIISFPSEEIPLTYFLKYL